jgi:dethiobiotin synthetase/adenosylmethionine--8-amino-7-oxononanoate aminotransferase
VPQGDLYTPLRDTGSVVLVGDGRLGGISVTLSSLEALLHRKYNVSGILLLRHGEKDYDDCTNQHALQEYITSHAACVGDRDSSPILFDDPEKSIVSLPKLPPEPEPLTEWYESTDVSTTLSSFVHDHLIPGYQTSMNR